MVIFSFGSTSNKTNGALKESSLNTTNFLIHINSKSQVIDLDISLYTPGYYLIFQCSGRKFTDNEIKI